MFPREEIEVWPYLLREALDMIMNGYGDNNDVKSIRNIFASVGLRHRQNLLSYGPEKTLLYQAVDYGLENIVNFLIVECEANVEKGILKSFWNFPPLFSAIKNGNMSMVKLLVNLGANVNAPTYNGSTVVNEACEFGRLSIAKFLMNKGADIYTNGHVMRLGQSLSYLISAVELGCDVNVTDDMGRNPLIYAADMKRYDIISYLIEQNVDILQRDKRANNALSVAIHKNDTDFINYLIESVFPVEEVVKTFEIQGSKMAIQHNFTEASQYWKEAFHFREKYSLPRNDSEIQTLGIYTPFQSKEELLKRRFNEKYMMFEALNIFMRVMTPFHSFSADAAIKISEMFSDDTYVSNDLLMDIFRLNWENPDPLSNHLHTVFLNIITSHSSRKSFDAGNALTQIHLYMDFIEEKVWSVLSKSERTRMLVTEKYANIIFILIKFVQFLLDSGPSPEQSISLLGRLRLMLIKEKSRNLPTTLLHLAVKLDIYFGVKLLVQCGADISAMDHHNNIPLHHVGLALNEHKVQIASFLVKCGSDVDAVNFARNNVQMTLKANNIIKNNLDQISLKCLAAKTISKNKVVVFEDECPRDIIPIIKRHGGMVHVRKETR